MKLRSIAAADLEAIEGAIQATLKDVRWVVGEHPDLLRLLELLAIRMFLAGAASKKKRRKNQPKLVKEAA